MIFSLINLPVTPDSMRILVVIDAMEREVNKVIAADAYNDKGSYNTGITHHPGVTYVHDHAKYSENGRSKNPLEGTKVFNLRNLFLSLEQKHVR